MSKFLFLALLLPLCLVAEDAAKPAPPKVSPENQLKLAKLEIKEMQAEAAEKAVGAEFGQIAQSACPLQGGTAYKLTKVGDEWQCVAQPAAPKTK